MQFRYKKTGIKNEVIIVLYRIRGQSFSILRTLFNSYQHLTYKRLHFLYKKVKQRTQTIFRGRLMVECKLAQCIEAKFHGIENINKHLTFFLNLVTIYCMLNNFSHTLIDTTV